MMPEPATPHRNSLGYTVNNDARRYEAGAKIVWGQSPDGSFVSISDAASGVQPDLRCDCGSSLVAKKGALLAHHFAHAAGAVASCQKAKVGALARFVIDVLGPSSLLLLPRRNVEQPPITVDIEEVVPLDGPVMVVCKKGSRKLKLYISASTSQKAFIERMSHMDGPSAILIDITKLRGRDDMALRNGILNFAPRKWLHDARPAKPARTADHPVATDPSGELERRIVPHRQQTGFKDVPLPSPPSKLHGDELAKRLNELYPVEDEIARLAIKRDARPRRER